jgi:putative transposase
MQDAKIPREKQLEQLQSFLDSHPSPSEIKRALAVKLALEGHGEHHISKLLHFSSRSIHKWTQTFQKKGIDGLLTDYKQPQKLNKQAALAEINRIFFRKIGIY